MTYEIRSKFVITSLRPAFAKIYPSTRPDLAVETFFHARPGSPLLRGITDDDFITWFAKTELASLKTNANIDNICECGRICSRDYEFRKPNANSKEATTNSIDTTSTSEKMPTTADYTTKETTEITTEPITTANTITEIHKTTSNYVTVSEQLTEIPETTTSHVLTNNTETNGVIITISDVTLPDGPFATIIDDPIIIPTVTFRNETDANEISNNIEPLPSKVNGELIVQKSTVNKPSPRKENPKKKPLPRRKGTLKATYGDKHDKMFFAQDIVSTSTTAYQKPEILSTKMTVTPIEYKKAVVLKSKLEKRIDLFVPSTPTNAPVITTQPIGTTTVFSHLEIESQPDKSTTSLESHHNDHTLAAHITAITTSNIKSMHFRTKKPKTSTQIKKPSYLDVVKEVDKSNKMVIEKENNKTNKKAIINKYTVKTLKSINKEIHQIPPTPISETSKTLSEPPKLDIAPENKSSFEILDKNKLGWELLKETPDVDSTKIDDKLQSRINVLQNLSNITENRSL